jgi:hypothetical protein
MHAAGAGVPEGTCIGLPMKSTYLSWSLSYSQFLPFGKKVMITSESWVLIPHNPNRLPTKQFNHPFYQKGTSSPFAQRSRTAPVLLTARFTGGCMTDLYLILKTKKHLGK